MNEREIFQKALEISDADKRQAFLNGACGANTNLRASVASLLASHEVASDFLNIPALQQISSARADGVQPTMQFGNSKTSPNEPDMGADDDGSESDPLPNLSFLEPSTKPGSLGTLGHYEVLELLGQGGFGVVFKAFDEKLCRLVAIKTMDQQMASTSPPRKRFLREARSAAAIKNDNIVQVYSVEEQPLPYLVMEFVDGATLQEKIDDFGPLDVPELLHLARQMASGLAAAHAQGLIHRDIKPGNILIEAGVEQKVKITDFGLARAADDASLTRSGMISGTPLYMAPEQALGQTMDQRTDLFSLGSVLYQMACGRPPFRAPGTLAIMKRVTEDTQRPLSEIVSEIPGWLVAIIDRLLEKKPEDRFQTSKEVADLLARCQSELQLTGKVTCVEPRAGSVSARSQPCESPAATALMPAISEGSRPSLAGQSLPRGVLGQVWHDWWSERDRWVVLSVETVLVVACLVCMLCFVSMGQSSGHDPEGHVTFDYQLGRPAPWYRFEVYPDTTTPFRMGFQPFASSVLVGCLGCLAWWVYWRIEKVRNPQASRWASPRFMLGIWAIGAVIAVGIGQWQGYAHLSQPQVAITAPLASGRREPVESPASSPTLADTEGLRPPLATKTGWQGWPADAPAPAISPFDAAQAKQHQEEWAAYLKLPVEYTNSLGMQFRLIPPGEFTMRSSPEEIDEAMKGFDEVNLAWWKKLIESEAPQHTVILTQPFYLGTQEVTQKRYESIVGRNPSHFASTGAGAAVVAGLDTANYPVDSLSWVDAAEFCNKLCPSNESTPYYLRTGEAFTLLKGNGYRLPTEEEWEFVCRAGTMTKFWSGDTDAELVRAGWFNVNSGGRTHAVGELASNPLGLFDIHGNVNEWVGYNWDPNSYAQSGDSAAVDPAPPVDFSPTSLRTIRGGSYLVVPLFSRSSARGGQGAADIVTTNGLRVALSVDAVKAERQRLADPDRALAEWVLSLPEPRSLQIEGQGDALVTRLEDLPVTPFRLYFIRCQHAGQMDDTDLARIVAARVSCILLDSPDQRFPNITDRGLEALAQSRFADSGRLLIINGELEQVTDAGVLGFNHCQNMGDLQLGSRNLTDKSLLGLKLNQLATLGLDNYGRPSDAAKFTARGLADIALRLPNLSVWTLGNADLGAGNISAIKALKLVTLQLVSCRLSDKNLRVISRIPSLKSLVIDKNPELTEAGFEQLAVLTNLEFLRVHGGGFNDNALKSLAGLTRLKSLVLERFPITDAAITALESMTALEHLYVGGSGISDQGVGVIAKLPALKSLYINGCPEITDSGLERLATATTLAELHIGDNPQLTLPVVRKLEAALPKCKIVSDFPEVGSP